MVEVAIFLISVSLFLEFGGLAYVVYTLWSNQRKNTKYLKDMNERFEKVSAETRKAYEDARKAYQDIQAKTQVSGVPVANNFWGTKN